jgi:hypothetical protein
MYLAISPKHDPVMIPTVNAILQEAPKGSSWDILVGKQQKEWNYQFNLELADGARAIDASKWRFVILRFPNGVYELLFEGREAKTLSAGERARAAMVVAEGALGELFLMVSRLDIELVGRMDNKERAASRPISELKEAFGF